MSKTTQFYIAVALATWGYLHEMITLSEGEFW